MTTTSPQPNGQLVLQTFAMPKDTNWNGDIFGGWLMAQMDLAGAELAHQVAKGRTATVGVGNMSFHVPVKVGDTVSCYADVQRIGNTSVTISIEVWTSRFDKTKAIKAAEGVLTFVAIDDDRNKRIIPKS